MQGIHIHKSCSWLIAVALLIPLITRAQSDVPRTISHQGLLIDSSTGDPVADASYVVRFRLYQTDAGGTAIWTETHTVMTTNGVYNAVLGSLTTLDPIPFNGELWLSYQIEPDPEMIDRTKLTSVPYAIGLALPFSDTVASNIPLIHLNNTGTSDGILVTNTGSGTAGAFVQQDPTSEDTGVYGQSNGLGAAVYGQHLGTGYAGRFLVANASSDAAALYVETAGTGPGAFVKDGRVEVEFDSQLGNPHVLIRETSATDFARLSLRNDDNLNYWDIAAGGPGNLALNFFRAGTGDVMSLRSSGRVGIGTTSPDERLHVAGTIKADSVVYSSPLHGYASIHGSAFLPFKEDGIIRWQRSNGGFHYTAGTVTAAFGSIQFPHGAHLESLSCRIGDATTSENLTCTLCRESGTGCSPLGEVTSNDVSGGLDTYSAALTIPLTVNNETQSFYVIVSTEGGTSWSTYFDSLQIVGVSVGYTIGGAP